jgi:hypothetical protein
MDMDRFDAIAGARAAELRRAYPAVQRCEALLEDRPPHRYERRRFNVRLEIDCAGRSFVINREHDDDPAAALEQAFDAARRTLG